MCNLYKLSSSAEEVSRWFSAVNAAEGANLSSEIYPGYPGLVSVSGAIKKMVWGFPLVLKSKRTGEPLKPRPVNNARMDKLDSFMWRYSFAERRCLIPLNAWAEAEGAKGSKTRTWLSLPDTDLFAVAGIWRDSDEWGPCYSMVMTDSAGEVAEVHNRMPVILSGEDARTWQEGSPDEARALCTAFKGPVVITRTNGPWTR